MVRPGSVRLRKAISTLESCLFCQFQRPIDPLIRRASTSTSTQPPSLFKPPETSYKPDNEHNPKPLDRPLGQRKPPKAGENSGIDTRTWRQRRDDFLNYDKHLERRSRL